jgi:hypothetical protein
MVRWPRILVSALVLLGSLVLVGYTQTIRSVQIQMPDIREPRASDPRDNDRYVRNLSVLTAAILETNHIAREHPLDFVVLSGSTQVLPVDPTMAADLAGRFFATLDANRIVLALDMAPGVPSSWRETFARQLAAAMPGKELKDIEGPVFSLNGITFTAVDSGALTSKNATLSKAELDRVDAALKHAKTLILFTQSVATSSKVTAGSLWALSAPDEVQWSNLLKNANLAGIMVSGEGSPADVHPTAIPKSADKMAATHNVPVYFLPTLDKGSGKPDSVRGLTILVMDAAGQIETRPLFWANGFSEEARDLQSTLIQASVSEGDEDYETAYKQYAEALKSKDAGVRSQAEAGLRRTNEKLQSPWEVWKRDSVIVGLVAKHAKDITIAVLLGCGILTVGIVRYRRRSEASLNVPTKLSEAAPAELFRLCILREMRGIREVWSVAGSTLKTKGEFELDPAPEKAKGVLEDLPNLIGETPTSIVKSIFFFWRYFAWSVESSIYGTEQNCTVYVKLCWGWRTEASWVLPLAEGEPIGIRECASEIAYNLSSYSRIKK